VIISILLSGTTVTCANIGIEGTRYTRPSCRALGGIKMSRKLLIMFVLTSLLLVGYTLAQQSARITSSHDKDEEAIHQTLRLYERMWSSEDLDLLDKVFHPMFILCWQSKNPHTQSREDYREDLRETFGRRDFREVKLYDTQIDLAEDIAMLNCKEKYVFNDTNIADRNLVRMILLRSNKSWQILTHVTLRNTSSAEPMERVPVRVERENIYGPSTSIITEGIIWYVEYELGEGKSTGFTRSKHAVTLPGGSGGLNVDAYGKLTSQFLIITYPQRKDLGQFIIPVSRLLSIQFGDGGINEVNE